MNPICRSSDLPKAAKEVALKHSKWKSEDFLINMKKENHTSLSLLRPMVRTEIFAYETVKKKKKFA